MSNIAQSSPHYAPPLVAAKAGFNGAVPWAAFVLILTLPFMQLFTVNFVFPLKVFEIAIIVWGLTAVLMLRIHVFDVPVLIFGILLTFYCVIALTINLRILDNVGNFSHLARWSPEIDGLTKAAYLLICVLGLNLVAYAAYFKPKLAVDLWIIGALLAASVHFALFLMTLAGMSLPNLPGMPDNPQMIDLAGMRLYRAATFLEGNYAGPFFILSFLLACYRYYRLRACLLLTAALLTFSTTALLGLAAAGLYWMLTSKNAMSKIKVLLLAVPLLFVGAPLLDTFVLDKISDDSENSSISDRTATALEALGMFQNNVVIGVGISQYGFGVPGRTRWDFTRNDFAVEKDKGIPNNVYAETLSELGLMGLLFLGAFLVAIFRIIWRCPHPLLRAGAYAVFLFWISSPTITLMYYWAYLGLVCGIARYEMRLASRQPIGGQRSAVVAK
ncbi:O-antigen ligase family protein [Agrobacterium sp. BA1120]|uniref:O-antigen ligase family protein n=1 Tax=Agrobacterium sp. BA1120 TaxID=3228927 RepID=UPI003369DB7B